LVIVGAPVAKRRVENAVAAAGVGGLERERERDTSGKGNKVLTTRPTKTIAQKHIQIAQKHIQTAQKERET
jgi:hypothetical protein